MEAGDSSTMWYLLNERRIHFNTVTSGVAQPILPKYHTLVFMTCQQVL